MNYHNITYPDMNNGDGLRVVLWLSGCSHHCKHCQNPQTWDSNSGVLFDNDAEIELFQELDKDYISGITFSGGDPLHENNIDGVLEIINKIKISLPGKTIWLYSGYTWEDLWNDSKITLDEVGLKFYEDNKKRKAIVCLSDVFVDGEYIDSQRDITLRWKGSSNQRVIDVKESLNQNEVILYCD